MGGCARSPLSRLDLAGTAVLAARVLGGPPSRLAALLYHRTQVPFFVEELSAALVDSSRLTDGPGGWELAGAGEVPIPDTPRRGPPACRWSVRRRPRSARGCGRFGAGHRPRPRRGSCRDRGGANGADRAWAPDRRRSGQAVFRHALAREAVYGEVPWPRRRALHRTIATELAERSTAAAIVAEHWLAGREFEQGGERSLPPPMRRARCMPTAMPRAHCSEPLSSGQRMVPRSSGWQPLTGSARVRNGQETWLERCEPGTRPLPAFARLGISGGGRD